MVSAVDPIGSDGKAYAFLLSSFAHRFFSEHLDSLSSSDGVPSQRRTDGVTDDRTVVTWASARDLRVELFVGDDSSWGYLRVVCHECNLPPFCFLFDLGSFPLQ